MATVDKVASFRDARAARSKGVPLTSTKVRSLKPRAALYQVSDSEARGLIVRVYPSGAKVYYAEGRIGGGRQAPKRRVRIGDAGQVALGNARREARSLVARMADGEDPTVTLPGEMPVATLLGRYADHLRERQVVKTAEVIRSLEVNLRRYAHAPVGSLTRPMVLDVMRRIAEDGRQGAADYFRKNAAGFLNFAVNEGILPASPMAGFRKPRDTRAETLGRGRITFTSPEEVCAFWQATAGLPSVYRDILRFVLLTGQRRTETALARWEDMGAAEWKIPALHAKTGVAHRVPLGLMSAPLIAAQPRHAGCPLVFAGRRERPISGWTAILAPVRQAMNLPAFAPHALRRTFRTGLEELGVPVPLCELMIAHRRSDLEGRYSKAELWQARVDAQTKWEAHIAESVR